jgi:hypothetical protein
MPACPPDGLVEYDLCRLIGQLDRARRLFERYEPRDLFYRVSIDLLRRARSRRGEFTVAEAVAVVLQTWNRRFYVSTGIRFDADHFADIEDLLYRHQVALDRYRRRAVESLRPDEQREIEALFDDFDGVLGPPGASKALHVLAPRFFPPMGRRGRTRRVALLRETGHEWRALLALNGQDEARVRRTR